MFVLYMYNYLRDENCYEVLLSVCWLKNSFKYNSFKIKLIRWKYLVWIKIDKIEILVYLVFEDNLDISSNINMKNVFLFVL